MERRSGRRWWRWIVFIPAGLTAAVAFWGLLDAVDGASARTVWNRTWTGADGEELGGYLIVPTDARRLVSSPATRTIVTAERSADGRYPAVLLIHERWGLTVDTARLADQLAADGYIVLAVDALRGRRAVSVPGALALSAMTPTDRIDRDIDRALDELAALPDVDPERIAVAGFGFGAVRAMGLGGRRADIAATAIFCLIFAWNEYAFALLLTSGEAQTAPPFIPIIIGEGGLDWPAVAAGTTLFLVPIVVFTIILRNQLLRGITFGAVRK